MESALQPCPAWTELETEHRQWLSAFDSQYLRNWEKLLNADYEAALCEAAVRRLLQSHGVTVQPNEDLAGNGPTGAEQRPDFRCTGPQGEFFVEVTCLQIATVVEKTDLPHPFQPGIAQNYGSLNDAIFEKCRKKTKQCSKVDLPTLLAVGTFHSHASAMCFSKKFADMLLTGTTSLTWFVNKETGESVGDAFQITKLDAASFLKPGSQSICEARTPLSGLLLCGFGFLPPTVLGILHPDPVRSFDRQWLPNIQFGEVQINRATGQLCTCWPASGS